VVSLVIRPLFHCRKSGLKIGGLLSKQCSKEHIFKLNVWWNFLGNIGHTTIFYIGSCQVTFHSSLSNHIQDSYKYIYH
jgi:hypothetical protein